MSVLDQLLNVRSVDPEDARRRKLLNILLFGVGAGTILALAAVLVATAFGLPIGEEEEVRRLHMSIGVALVGILAIFLINRYGAGILASSLFLLLLTAAFAVGDEVPQVADGRSMFLFAIPILMASVLLRPYASFIMAAVVNVLLAALAVAVLRIGLQVPAMLGFFAIALVSWLSARSLERALAALRRTNLELDQRVDERTQDLAEALAREHAEASKGQAILTSIADGVIVFDGSGAATIANPAIGRILDRPADEIAGSDLESLMGEAVDADDRELIAGLLRRREKHRSSVKFDWGAKTLSVTFAPVRGAREDVGTVAVFRDFTREAEVDRLKSDFVSIVSHELRTPLTSIKGYLDLVIMGAAGAFNKQQESFLKITRDNAERLHELVSHLLDISRIEAGKLDLDIQVVSLPKVIEQTAGGLQKEFEDRDLTLTVDIPPSLPETFGDPNRISQILDNLLSNAYKYTVEGGATVRVRVVQDALQIDVVDTGVGIAQEDREKLFTRFFRAEEAMVRQQPGSGLGLNITRSLVELHGGEIWVESEPGKGSTFSFTLPLPVGLMEAADVPEAYVVTAPPEDVDTLTMPVVSVPIPAGPWILVADDEVNVSALFKRQLEREGFRVTVVNQGSRVVEVARQLRPELITLDLLMEVDGLGVLEELKADPITADIPVVIISVVPESQRGLSLGAVDYLCKPLDEGQLLDCVREVFNQLGGGARNKILVVDDEIDIVGWLKHSLTHYGYEVLEAYDGIQALEVVDDETPDLILLDLKMPRMDGRTTMRRLRERADTRHIPIIVLTANPVRDATERAQMMRMGVREFLHKPVKVGQLVEQLRKHLEGSKPRAVT
jgi:PAS domain S-box-containing protein